MRDVIVTPRFERDLKKIPPETILAFDQTLPRLRRFPTDTSLRIKKLVNIHPPVWRLRIGAYRLLYTFDMQHLFLIGFKHRKDVYGTL